MNTFSLHDYRLAYPATAAVPTITQGGFIGPILDRHHRELLRTMRRYARQERVWNLIARLCAGLWKLFARPTALTRRSHPAASVPTH